MIVCEKTNFQDVMCICD